MTTFVARASYHGSTLKITVPTHGAFLSELFKKVPERCLTVGAFSPDHSQVEIEIRDGFYQVAQNIYCKHFPFGPVIGGWGR